MERANRRAPFESKVAACVLVVAVLIPHHSAFAAESNNGSPSASRAAVEASMRNDAALADVCFVDASTGWAVGDRGVIWRTLDGGSSWTGQSSGVTCRLDSVYFVDPRRGWSVGGASRSVGRASQGVVLRTTDGGSTWQRVSAPLVPRLRRVKFFDPNVGVAIGDCAPAFPAGAFTTSDGGHTWQLLAADEATGWLAGDFLDRDTGAVAGTSGQFATVARRRVMHSPLATSSLRSARDMQLVAPAAGWLVGDGGLVMTTNDLGHSWQSPAGGLPDNAGEHFDFHAVTVYKGHVWIAGSPGTCVFHSADGGQTWDVFDTGSLTPLRALSFIDAERGWAVGDLGRILATTDGGETWRVQRAGAQRAALLAVFGKPTDVPLEVVAEQGAAEAYVAAVDILNSQPASRDRTREAMLAAGAAADETAWRFPLPPDDLDLSPAGQLAALDRANDGRAIRQLEQHLVTQLRMWRPDVVITHHAPADEEAAESMDSLVEKLVLRAVERAADTSQAGELVAGTGLIPWQVKRVFGVAPAGSQGDESIPTGRFSPWLGASLADWSAPARRLLVGKHATPPDVHELHLLFADDRAAASGTGGRRGLFGGIALAHGSDARRPAPELQLDELDNLRRHATRRRHLEKLMEVSEGNAAWAAQLGALIEGLDANAGAELLSQLATGYRQTGRLDLAADTYYLLARSWPDHPLAEPALHWLVHFYASGEAAHRASAHVLQTLVRDEVPRTSVREDFANMRTEVRGTLDARAEVGGTSTEVRAAAFEQLASAAPAVGLSPDDRLRRAAQLAEYLKTARPALYAEPSVRFAEVTAQRRLGYANEAKRYFLTLGQHAKNDPWRRCAESEQWLSQPGEMPPPKALAACRRAAEPPHLDGRLDDMLWTTAGRLRLRAENNANNASPPAGGEVRLAYDDEFLFLAVLCPKAAGRYRPDSSPRPRDADLGANDRVALRFDVDRDYTTAFELTIDHRGWTHDACWGDATWNPTWYVATGGDKETWIVEAALPLSQLTAEPPAARHVWAVSARRTIPRVGYESWAGEPAEDNSPDQFGLVIFE